MIVLTDLQRCKLDLADLKQDNVEEFVEKSYNRWKYYISDKVTLDGEEIEGSERFFITQPMNEKGDRRTGVVEMSDKTKEGFELTKELFINEQLKKCKPVYQETIGSVKYRELNLKLKIYIDYLNNQFLLPQETIVETKENYKNIHYKLREYINNGDAETYQSIIEDGNLPKEGIYLEFKKKNKGDIVRFLDCFDLNLAKSIEIFGEKVDYNSRPKTYNDVFSRVLKEINPKYAIFIKNKTTKTNKS